MNTCRLEISRFGMFSHKVRHIAPLAGPFAVVVLLMLFTPAQALAAQVRFVATWGSNTNNNCLNGAAPCLTIGHALAKAAPGDEIFINPGNYDEHLTIGKDTTIVGSDRNNTAVDGLQNAGLLIHVNKGTTVSISHLTITRGSGNLGGPGGIENEGTLTLKDTDVSFNIGGGIANYGTLTIKSSSVFQNLQAVEGGGIFNQGQLKMNGGKIEVNDASRGGGLASVGGGSTSLTDVTIDKNSANKGGGIYDYDGSLVLRRVTIDSNTAESKGGGIDNDIGAAWLKDVAVTNNHVNYGDGGGILNKNFLTMNRATFDHNVGAGGGGGLANEEGPATLTNVTFHNNFANTGGDVYNALQHGDTSGSIPVATLKNVTIFEPGAIYFGTGIYNTNGTVKLKNTIVSTYPSETACSGTITSLGHNLGDTGCGLKASMHDLIAVDPRLDIFRNWGGFTKTFYLLSDSPAIDAGTNNGCPKNDQLGLLRPQDGNNDGTAVCDIGAVEFPPHFGGD
jgi:hypothetical protein